MPYANGTSHRTRRNKFFHSLVRPLNATSLVDCYDSILHAVDHGFQFMLALRCVTQDPFYVRRG
jgi:hypothetical protein